VKYRERVTSTDAIRLVEFMHVFDQSAGILVTTDEFGKDVIDGRDVLFIPIWLFLLVL
jgi:predicted AAA+ superfamily ATPase